jgi:hypothetical protein
MIAMPDLPDNVRPPELAQLLGVGARTLDRAVAAGFLQRANGKYRLQDFVQGFRDLRVGLENAETLAGINPGFRLIICFAG